MRLGVKLIAGLALATVISAADSGRAFADCATRHFYNHSNMPWTIVMGKDAGACSYGNSGNVLMCTIPPRQTGEIHYASTFFYQALNAVTKGLAAVNGGPSVQNVPAGNVMIVSGDNGKVYPAHYFEIQNGPTKCYLKHSGNTGNVVLNDPADGDIATCGRGPGGNYDCH